MKFATPEEALQNIKANEDEIKDLLFEMLVAWQTHEIAGNSGDFSEFISDGLRFDSKTGLPMTRGWVVDSGAYYLADIEDVEALCQELWGETLDEAYSDNEDYVYYTEWF